MSAAAWVHHRSRALAVLIEHLESIIARGGSSLDLIRALEDELTGGDLLDIEMKQGRAAFTNAAAREREIRRNRRGAEALDAASRGGLYLPHEIPQLAAGRYSDPSWIVRESIRFLCFEVALRELNGRLASRSLAAGDYVSAVVELATRVSRVRVHEGTRR